MSIRHRRIGSATVAGLLTAAVGLALRPACSPKPAPPVPVAPAPVTADKENPGPPIFDDATAASGVSFSYRNGEDAGHFAIIESLGGGAAMIDFDGDGLLDLFLPGGGYFEGQKVRGHPCGLYRNLG